MSLKVLGSETIVFHCSQPHEYAASPEVDDRRHTSSNGAQIVCLVWDLAKTKSVLRLFLKKSTFFLGGWWFWWVLGSCDRALSCHQKRLHDPVFYGQSTSRMSISHLELWGLYIWALGSPKEPKNDPTYPQFLPFSLVSWRYQKWLHDPIFYTKPTLSASRMSKSPIWNSGGPICDHRGPSTDPKKYPI